MRVRNGLVAALAAWMLALCPVLPGLAEDAVFSAPVEVEAFEAEIVIGEAEAAAEALERARPEVLAGEADFTVEKGVLVKYSGAGGEVTVPAGITVIGAEAFSGCDALTGVDIPGGVTSIERSAFAGCAGLTRAGLPDGVTQIGQEAFAGCAALPEIDVPGSVLEIGAGAFSGCRSLAKATLNEGLRIIRGGAFKGCVLLGEVALPESLESVAEDAFQDCVDTTVQAVAGCAAEADVKKLRDVKATLTPPRPTGLTLDVSKASMALGQTLTLRATVSPEGADAALRYESGDPAVARVSEQGVITAVKAGKATITVSTVNGIRRTVKVTVKPLPKKVSLNRSGTVTLIAGRTLQLKATLSPKGTLAGLTWKSSEKRKVEVSKNGLVTALREGKSTITVKTDNGKKARVTIRVKPSLKELSGILGQKVKSVNKKLGHPLKKADWTDDGIYENGAISVSVDKKGRIVSIYLSETAKDYRLFRLRPGMTRIQARVALQCAGVRIGLDTREQISFSVADDPGKSGQAMFSTDGKLVLAFLNQTNP